MMKIKNVIKSGFLLLCMSSSFVGADGMRVGRPMVVTTTRIAHIETVQSTIQVQDEGAVVSQTLMEKVKDFEYKGKKLKDRNAQFLDNAVYTLGACHKMGTLNDILLVVETMLQAITQKKKSFDADTAVLVEVELKKIIDGFSDFAVLARSYAKVIIPLIQESLTVEKFEKLSLAKEIIAAEMKESMIEACVKSKEDIATFFNARIKTEDDLALFAFELKVALNDVRRSCPKAMALYRRSK